MSRADRWWRPASRRPAVRARSRMYRYNQYDVNLAYDRGIMRGTRDTVERHQDRELIEQAFQADPERFRRLAEALELGGELGKRALERLAREWGIFPDDDDLTDVAREAGVLDDRYAEGYADGLHRALSDEEDKALWDSVPPHGSGMVVEIEQWLRDRGRWLDFLRENGDLPDED